MSRNLNSHRGTATHTVLALVGLGLASVTFGALVVGPALGKFRTDKDSGWSWGQPETRVAQREPAAITEDEAPRPRRRSRRSASAEGGRNTVAPPKVTVRGVDSPSEPRAGSLEEAAAEPEAPDHNDRREADQPGEERESPRRREDEGESRPRRRVERDTDEVRPERRDEERGLEARREARKREEQARERDLERQSEERAREREREREERKERVAREERADREKREAERRESRRQVAARKTDQPGAERADRGGEGSRSQTSRRGLRVAARPTRIEAPSDEDADEDAPVYRVRVGRYTSLEEAERVRDEVNMAAGTPASVVRIGVRYRVQVGAFKNRVNAEQAAENLRALKYRAVVTEGKRTRRAPGTES